MAGHNKQHGLGSGLDHTAATTAQINALVSDGQLTSNLDNVVYVSKTGLDTNNGTFENPFLTIKAAVAAVTAGTPGFTNRYVIKVAPGQYTEDNPIQMPVFTTLETVGEDFSVSLTAANVNSNFFELVASNAISGFAVNGPSNATCFNIAVPVGVIMSKMTLVNCLRGIVLNDATSSITLSDIFALNTSVTGESVIEVQAGFVRASNVVLLPASNHTSVIKLSGSSTEGYINVCDTRSNVLDTAIDVSGGAVATILSSRFVGEANDTGSITAFADGGGGQVVVTSASHNIAENTPVTITGTTNYNGTFTATNVTTNTFEITDTWVSDDATGTWVSDNRIGTAIKVVGDGSHADVFSTYIQHADYGLYVDNSIETHLTGVVFENCDYGIYTHTTGSPRVEYSGGSIKDSVTWDVYLSTSGATLIVAGAAINEDLLYLNGATVSMCHVSDNEGDEGTGIKGELHVGYPEKGSESVLGEGDSYVRGMNVYTTDGTATSTTDGGNLTDESAAAKSFSGSTFSFQGVTANHTILIGSSLISIAAAEVVKHWGLKVLQTTAAVEVTAKSFVFEYWNGSAWTALQVMSTQSDTYVPYANETFIRANSTEHIRYGLDESAVGTDWTKKTIDSKNLFWVRIRIATTITTAPVFQQFKLSPNRFEANADGTNTYHGRSRFRQSLSASGNSFGESGGVAAWNLAVGSGGLPTGWTHNMKNSELGTDGDAIYYQYTLPAGIDTSLPLFVYVVVSPSTTGTTQGIDLILSLKPVEIQGVSVADPAGGLTPVARTLANTATVTASAGVADTVTLDDTNLGKINLLEFGPFEISDFYQGDLVFLRLELDDDGTGATNVGIVEIDLSGVKWRHGDKL